MVYLAPEIFDKTVPYQGYDADCFAFGVSIFISMTLDEPWKNPNPIEDDRYNLLVGDYSQNSDKFWKEYSDLELSSDFKNLIELLLAKEPSSRPTMADILGLEWMRGPLGQVDFETICHQILEKKSTEIQEISLNYYWEKPITRMRNLSDIKKDVMLRPLREL